MQEDIRYPSETKNHFFLFLIFLFNLKLDEKLMKIEY